MIIKQLYQKTSIEINININYEEKCYKINFSSNNGMDCYMKSNFLPLSKLDFEIESIYFNLYKEDKVPFEPKKYFNGFFDFIDNWIKSNKDIIVSIIKENANRQMDVLMRNFEKDHDKKEYYIQYFTIKKMLKEV